MSYFAPACPSDAPLFFAPQGDAYVLRLGSLSMLLFFQGALIEDDGHRSLLFQEATNGVTSRVEISRYRGYAFVEHRDSLHQYDAKMFDAVVRLVSERFPMTQYVLMSVAA